MREWIATAGLPTTGSVLLGMLFLHMFFRTVESRWPTSYFALASGPDYAISRNLLRYLSFRLVPVFVVGIFVAVTLERAGLAPALAVISIGVLHACSTSGRALFADVRSPRRRQRSLRILVHLVVVVAVVLVALLSLWAAPTFSTVVPGIDRISSDLLTGLVAGVIAAYAIQVSSGSHLEMDRVLKASRKAIPDHLWDAVPELAAAADADVTLIRAVMLVENIQRPAWVRRLERIGSWMIGKPGTLGILQTRGTATATDEQLLRKAIRDQFRRQRPPADLSAYESWDWLDRFARRYNPDRNFVDALHEAVLFLQSGR